jgi:hypothetical protein
MKAIRKVSVAVLILVGGCNLCGCSYAGLSPRDYQSEGYSNYVQTLYASAPSREPAAFSPPARVGVVQVGEMSPPQSMLKTLRKHPDLFPNVQGLPGVTLGNREYRDSKTTTVPPDLMRSLHEVAADSGLDHVLVFSGTVDYDRYGTPLSVLNLTIVGMFIFPTTQIKAEGNASGVLVDLRSQRVVQVVSADGSRSRFTPVISESSTEASLLKDLRDDLVDEMAKNLIVQCRTPRALAAN